jgi:hypothetical protein
MEDNSINQMNFNLPHDVIQLPSQGKFYKNKKKSVKVGYLTAADENILSNFTNMGGDQIIYNLVRSKVYEPDLKIEEMLDGDIQAILMFLRNTSFTPEYKFSITDPETNKTFEHTEILDEINFRKLLIEPDENGHFETTLPKSNATVKLKILTFGDIKELNEKEASYPKNMTVPKITWRLAKQIVSINGNDDKGEIIKFIDKMPIMDSKYISKFLDENSPGLDLIKEITAPSGKKVLTRITFGAEFFRPFF